MTGFKALLRLQLLSRFADMKPKNLKTALKEKKGRTIGMFIAIAFLVVYLGVILYIVETKMLDIMVGMGAPEMLITMAVMLTTAGTLILSFFFTLSALYLGRDAAYLAALPLKPRTILSAKLVQVWISETLIDAIILLPACILYAVKVGVDPGFYLRMIVVWLLIALMPICVIAFVSSLLIRLSALWNPDDEPGRHYGRYRGRRTDDPGAGGEQQRPDRGDDEDVPAGSLGRQRHAGPELRHVYRVDPDFPGGAGHYGVAAGIQLPETVHAADGDPRRRQEEAYRQGILCGRLPAESLLHARDQDDPAGAELRNQHPADLLHACADGDHDPGGRRQFRRKQRRIQDVIRENESRHRDGYTGRRHGIHERYEPGTVHRGDAGRQGP